MNKHRSIARCRQNSRGAASLLRAVVLCPIYENIGYGSAKINAGFIVDWEVDARPDARIARFLAHGANEFSARGEKVGHDFRAARRERRVI